ncbi:uncharacterized protein LOC126418725 [Schistocerca serialis cubense]|uniref:uncharacterized protein LOC126418725 n=1 Tax=Schistocerca serialis cubense TaxID=2023355 RepID=UPI00214E2452|nr:uncharacterized protein LOC126418725 [Schistocerca serialis cubense]
MKTLFTCCVAVWLLIAAALLQPTKGDEMLPNTDIPATMAECNATFKLGWRCWDNLLSDGHVIDESKYQQKCWFYCLLDRTGAMHADGAFDKDLLKMVLQGFPNGPNLAHLDETTYTCVAQRSEVDLCERAYAIVKCIMTEELSRMHHSS